MGRYIEGKSILTRSQVRSLQEDGWYMLSSQVRFLQSTTAETCSRKKCYWNTVF